MRLYHYATAFLSLCCLAVFGASVRADVTLKQRTEDKRLEAPVTLSETRIHVAELLSRLSTQTGVDLKMNVRMDASGLPLTTSLVHLPLADAMNALTALVGCRSAKWYWERQGEPGHFAYRLQAPQLTETAARLRARVQTGFEQQASTLIKAAGMTPDQRKELIGVSKVDASMMADARVMSGIKIFSESVPADMKPRILRGETTLKLAISQLSPEGQNYVRSEYRLSGIINKDPLFINFEVNPLSLISPTLFMEVGDIGGHGYVGGVPLDRQFKEELAGEWVLPGDTLSSPLEAVIATRPKDYKPVLLPEVDLIHADELPRKVLDEYFARFNNVIQKRLIQMSQAAPVSLMAVVPTSQHDAGDPYGQTVGHFVAGLRKSDGLMSKWHGPVQLVNYGRWFLNMDSCAPYDVVERLKAQQNKGQGVLSLADLALVADDDRLTVKQLAALADDLPVFKSVSDLRGVFILCHRYPEVSSPGGILVTPDIAGIIDESSKVKVANLVVGARTRVYETVKIVDGRPASVIHFEMLGANKVMVSGLNVTQDNPAPEKPPTADK